MIVDTLPVFYYEKMVGYKPSSFVDLVFVGERIKVGLKRGKFDHPALTNKKPGANRENEKEGGTHVVTVVPTWPHFPPAQQCQYSTNISPSHYPPPYQPRTPNHPQRSSLNQPQSLPAAHPMPNTTLNTNQNTNQGRYFPTKAPIEFTPISVSYANLLPYLLNNSMVAITPAMHGAV